MGHHTPQYRQQALTMSYKKVRIITADPYAGYVDVMDGANQRFQVTLAGFHPSYVQIPKMNEYWLITRLDNNWVFHSRFENTDPEDTHPIRSLYGGDVRINAPNRLFIDAAEEVIIDFNKATPSLRELGVETIPGSAIYGSASVEYIKAGTVEIVNKLVTPFSSYLPSRNVVHGQETDLLFEADTEGYVNWRFKYNSFGTVDQWQFAGGPAYLNFQQGTVALSGTGTAWQGTASGPTITAPVSGEYILAGGAEAVSDNTNNVGYGIGLSINGANPGSAVLKGFLDQAGVSDAVNTTYQIRLTKNDVLRVWYTKVAPTHSGAVNYFNRWMQITPIRVQADPLDDPEPAEIGIYEGAS